MPIDPAGLSAPAASVCELSLVIAAFHEAGVLGDSVAAIARSVAEVTADYEIIVVDDGSYDATWTAVTAAHEADAQFCGLRLSRNFGKDAALSAGIERSRGRAIVVLDVGLQHPPALIPELYRAWKRGAEIVNGIKRDRTKEPLIRRLMSRMFHLAASRLTGLDFNNSSDFKLLDRRVVDAWLALPERRNFFRGMVAWLGFRAEDIYFDVARRAEADRNMACCALSVWRGRRRVPIRSRRCISFTCLPPHFCPQAWSSVLGRCTRSSPDKPSAASRR